MRPTHTNKKGFSFSKCFVFFVGILFLALIVVFVALTTATTSSAGGTDSRLATPDADAGNPTRTALRWRNHKLGGASSVDIAPPPAKTTIPDTIASQRSEQDGGGDSRNGGAAARSPLRPLPEAGIPPEPEAIFREWNAPYHAKRKRLRDEATPQGVAAFDLHTFYTLDCTFHSLWQVYTLEMTWHRVGQGGFISRVISGCDSLRDKQPMLARSVLPVAVEERQFGAYFAPTFSRLPNGEYYAPYNRPNAIWYWLNHTDLTEDVFVLLDPDMVFMNKLYYGDVQRGRPVAQWYIYMNHYKFENFECPLCPDREAAYGGGRKVHYEVGPPWMFHVDDLRAVMATWVALVPMLKAKDPNAWIIEMVAYSVAMAFHKLPHKVIYYGMIDNIAQEPLWNAADNTIRMDVNDGGVVRKLALLHYCYTWEVGERPPANAHLGNEQHERMKQRERQRRMPVLDYYHFSKYRVPTDWPGGKHHYSANFISCAAPLLQEFHTTNALPGMLDGKNQDWKRTMFFLRTLLPLINDATLEFKRRHLGCGAPGSSSRNALNGRKQLRTSHPKFWISRYVITKVHDDLATVDFVDPTAPVNQTLEEML